MNEEKFLDLAARALSQEATDEELKELAELMAADLSLHQRFEVLQRYWSESEKDNDSRREMILKDIMKRIKN